MSAPFVAEIRMWTCNFAPTGWALCAGQLMPISQNTALFSLLGTSFGGDGKSTFGPPNLQGNVPIHTDWFSGSGEYPIGALGGVPDVTLLTTEMPAHSHGVQANGTLNSADTADPNNASLASGNWRTSTASGAVATYSAESPDVQLGFNAIGISGGNQPHNNMMPYLTLTFCIALQGIFPQRG